MNLTLVIVILLILLLVGLPPVGLHEWGYAPSTALGVILVVLLVLALLGRL
jgi:hypothetical protein